MSGLLGGLVQGVDSLPGHLLAAVLTSLPTLPVQGVAQLKVGWVA
jgi:hypothetical protein